MAARFDSIELVVSDMEATLEFYRRLGLAIPEDAGSEGHVTVDLPGGVRIQLDTEEIMQSFSDWTPPTKEAGIAWRSPSNATLRAMSTRFSPKWSSTAPPRT